LQTLVVGLGNIGKEYEDTRHNIGFNVLDSVRSGDEVRKASFRGELWRDGNLFFLKPSTYMNLSGESISAVKDYFKIENILIVHDDLDLPFGAVRFKKGGGTGGHNGLKSLSPELQKESIRIRMGIGKPEFGTVSSFVLSKFSSEERPHLQEWIEISKKAILEILETENWEKVASKYSRKVKS
jgi:PTH1 family peptidyl-tRNA hydrolase